MSSEVKTGDPGPSTNLSRQTSAKSARSTLIRSTDAHPPHHAHFDIPEGPESHGGSVHSLVDMNDGSVDKDEKRVSTAVGTPAHPPVVDIEHVPCDDDPREWSDRKKSMVLAMMTIAVLGPLIAPSIYNPVIDEIKAELNASDTQIGLSLSMYILLQGWMPVIWASTAEIIGRKTVYLVSTAIFFVGSLVASRANTIEVLIGMRCLQASGSAAVVAVGAGSLADIFEVHERGQKLGLFYGMPLLGPALGPLIGGALGNSFGWRSALYFLAAFAGTVFCMLLFFPDTWRKERSRVYQKAIEQAIKRAMHHDEAKEKKRQRKLAKGLSSSAPTPPVTQPPSEPATRRNSIESTEEIIIEPDRNEVTLKHKWYDPRGFRKTKAAEEHAKIQPSIRDVNPFPTMLSIFRQPTNAVILFSSGILFAAQYTIPYTASVTLAKAPYNYNALYIGLIVLSFGIGSICGSILGGRYSDRVLRKLKKANGGVLQSEMRLRSTIVAMPLVVSAFLIYAWTAGKKVHVSGIVIALLLCGLSLMLIYSSTLAYLVDANPGRSASAVSCNSFIRGTFGAILSQVAVPIQSAIGDGGLYTILAGLLALSSGGILLLIWKGESWRSPDHTFIWQRGKRRRLAAQEETKETTSQAVTTEGTTVRSSTEGSVEGKS